VSINKKFCDIILRSVPEWQTSVPERLILVGLFAILKPEHALEVGVFKASGTFRIAEYCKSLYCVDPIQNFAPLPGNCTYFKTTSDEAFELFAQQKLRFDITVIDADHSEDHAYRDMKNALSMSDIVIAHDVYHDETCKGYMRAIAEQSNLIYLNNRMTHVEDACPEWGGYLLAVGSVQ